MVHGGSKLKGRDLFSLGCGAIIGVGWVTVLGFWLREAGALGAALAFLVGALLMLPIGFCYADAARRYPGAGGEMLYARRIFGIGPAFGTGWVLLLAYLSLIGFEAISAGWILTVLFPGIEGAIAFRFADEDVKLGEIAIGISGMAVIGILNFVGARVATGFQNLLTSFLLVISVIFIVCAFITGSPENLNPYFSSTLFDEALLGFSAILVTTPFWFAGFNVIPQALGEKSDSVKADTVKRIILLAIIVAGAFYVGIILAAAAAIPRAELLASDLPAARAFEAAFSSPLTGKLVLFAGFLGLITTWNAVFFAATRLLHAMAVEFTVASPFAKLHERYDTPYLIILWVSVVGVLLVALGRGAILPFVSLVGTCFAVMFLIVSLGTLKIRMRERSAPRHIGKVGIVTPIVAVLVSIGILGLSINVSSDSTAFLPLPWLIFLIWMIVGGVLWKANKLQKELVERSLARKRR